MGMQAPYTYCVYCENTMHVVHQLNHYSHASIVLNPIHKGITLVILMECLEK